MADFTMDRFSLKGKTALVTGAERGIGLEIAKGLAAAGANIIIAGLMEEEFPKAKAAVRAKGVSCTVLKADISKEEDVLRLAEQAWEIFPNGLDILAGARGGDAAGGLAEGRRRQSDGHVPHVPHVRKPDAAAGTRQYRERRVHVRSGREPAAAAAVRIQFIQGGRHHADKVHGQRVGAARRARQRDLPRLYRHAAHGQTAEYAERPRGRKVARRHADGKSRPTGRNGRIGALFCKRRVHVHDRRSPLR